MGRGKGRGKKQNVISPREDSGEEEKMPVKRRGRPQKAVKNNIEEKEEIEKIVAEDGENTKNFQSSEDMGNQILMENDQKRMKPSLDLVKEENGVGPKANDSDTVKFVGFRQNGSRRKNKPRRAAEVGVEC